MPVGARELVRLVRRVARISIHGIVARVSAASAYPRRIADRRGAGLAPRWHRVRTVAPHGVVDEDLWDLLARTTAFRRMVENGVVISIHNTERNLQIYLPR